MLQLSVWHKGGKFEKDRFLGRVPFPLSSVSINMAPKALWLKLLPRVVCNDICIGSRVCLTLSSNFARK